MPLRQLAIAGKKPLFKSPLHVGCPNIGDRQHLMSRINRILDQRILTNGGPMVTTFEEKIAEFTGVKHCISTCNGTMALELAIRAVGMSGEVIIPSMTFVATAHALQWQHITPVFCDVDQITHQMDPQKIEALISPRTTGILAVNLWGRVCAIGEIRSIAQKHNLKLIFDSAHALGASFQGTMVGGFGDAEILSFHATKFINSLEGGAVLTNDDDLANTLQLMRNFGFVGRDRVESVGINAKLNEMQAAMGITSLESMDDFIEVNRQNYYAYQRGLRGVPGIRVLPYDERENNNYQYIVIEVDAQRSGLKRDDLIEILRMENIDARRYFYPGCHRMEPYASMRHGRNHSLVSTESVLSRVVTLPTGTQVGHTAVRKIVALIRTIVAHSDELNYRLERFRFLGEADAPAVGQGTDSCLPLAV